MNGFEQYLNSIGGEQITQYSPQTSVPVDDGSWGQTWQPGVRPNIGFGSSIDNPAGPANPYGRYSSFSGYRDSGGNFLGWGSNPNDLYNNSPDLQRQYIEYIANEPRRRAQQLENEARAAEVARLQQEAIQQQRTQTLPSLTNFNPTPVGVLGQRQQQAPQQQGGLLNMIHRGGVQGGVPQGGGLYRGGQIAPTSGSGQ